MNAHATLDICSVSDLHLDHMVNWTIAEALAYRLIDLAPEVLILAGDLASIPSRVEKALSFFSRLAPHVLFVPGNHDLWAPTQDPAALQKVNTWEAYRSGLAEMCEEVGVHYLPAAPFTLGDVAFVGTCGWYDYSLASRIARGRFEARDYAKKAHGRYRWVDGMRIRWRDERGVAMSDAEVARRMEADVRAQLASLGPEIRTVVGISHHVPFEETCYSHRGLAGDFFTAFMGSAGLGQAFQSDPRVKTVLFGHQHRAVDTRVGEIRVLSTPLGTPRDWSGEPKAVAAERMAHVQLELSAA